MPLSSLGAGLVHLSRSFSGAQRQVRLRRCLASQEPYPWAPHSFHRVSGPMIQNSLLAPRCCPRDFQGGTIWGITVLRICQEEECVLYMGLKCPCCSEKGDSEKKGKSVPFAAARFPSYCCCWQRDAQSPIAGVSFLPTLRPSLAWSHRNPPSQDASSSIPESWPCL